MSDYIKPDYLKSIPREFYYSNVYPKDEGKSKHMGLKVKIDLTPFRDYLTNSKNNLMKASRVKADCFEIKNRTILKPRFTLIKVNTANCIKIKKPLGYYYSIEWNEEWGDVESFDAIMQRITPIVTSSDIIDVYNGKLFFHTDKELDCEKSYVLYVKDSDDGEKCIVKPVDFSDINSFRVELDNGESASSSIKEDHINIFYHGGKPSSIKLFNKLVIDIVSFEQVDWEISKFVLGNSKIVAWEQKDYFIVDEGVDDEKPTLYYDGQKIEYTIIEKQAIERIIGDKRVVFNDRKLEIIDPSFGEVEDKLTIKGLPFEILTLGDKLRKQFRKEGSIIVELIEDDHFSNDIYTNVSFFFRETTERLVDENEDEYRIGLKYENYNQIEILKVNKRNEPIPIQTIPKTLSIIPNARQIQMQLNALDSLINRPNKDHAPLLELMQDKRYAEFDACNYESVIIPKWYKLTNPDYEGCNNQREFVKKALATPDFAFLEGPPGSGKTTTILEIVAQMIAKGQKVILAASTNAAIDNILERLDTLPAEIKDKIIATRIGNESAISDSVENYKITRANEYYDEILERANLVCGTIIGILQHPQFNLSQKMAPIIPLYDCLIIDEASKTTFQEFLVPALYAKKWILSGDLKQLTPYIDQESIEASLTQIQGFNLFHQQAQAFLMLLDKEIFRRKNELGVKERFAIKVDGRVIDSLCELVDDYPYRAIGAISKRRNKYGYSVSKDEFISGEKSIFVYGADVLFIDKEIYDEVVELLPKDFIVVNGDNDFSDYQNRAYFKNFERKVFNSNVKDVSKYKVEIARLLKEKSWASEIAWRLCRIQELFMLKEIERTDSDRYKKQIEERIPTFAKEKIERTISLLQEISLPSVLQLLQKGIDHSVVENKNKTTLNSGFDGYDLQDRHTMLEYQHRMHNDISRFCAKEIYNGEALHNGTIINRNWDYSRYSRRAIWLNVNSDRNCSNENAKEVDVIVEEIKAFVEYASKNPKKNGEKWSIACLTYYRKQEKLLKEKIKNIFNDKRAKNYYVDENKDIELMIYTVDKFQGKEADVVFLSMIKCGAVPLGFMDSPNRLNVALTRAKYQMVIVGNKEYFNGNACKSRLLRKVAEEY